MKKLAIGNYAVARGAYEAGVTVSSAYPGTPSTEVTEFLAKYPEVKAEWAPNEKVALEVAIGASIAGARSIAAMKHVGLNVAADPLFTSAYTGVNGGLVVVVADDPGIHSSQNEQDSRYYAMSAKLPMLEPADSEEARAFTRLAYALSEQYDTPVLLRLTTRVAHSQSYIEEQPRDEVPVRPYVKDAAKYVMMPGNAKRKRVELESRLAAIARGFNALDCNRAEYRDTSTGVVCAGITYQYVREALPDASVFKIGTVYPVPVEAVRAFAARVKRLIVIEEMDGFNETALKAAGIACEGKSLFPHYGEIQTGEIRRVLCGAAAVKAEEAVPRPPVLCPGCPHRGVFYVINKLKLNVMGDIGCYTLGAVAPLSAVDAVVCMGASIGMTIGAEKARGREFAEKTLAVIGDSTFVHSGITGLIDAVYNNLNTKILILDNSTTGMTGHQPHPGTGRNIYDEPAYKLDYRRIAEACGVPNIAEFDSYDLAAAEKTIREQMKKPGVSLMIARQPCALIVKDRKPPYAINDKCVNCKMCVRLGCPAIVNRPDGPEIDFTMCVGCGVCAEVCKVGAIDMKGEADL